MPGSYGSGSLMPSSITTPPARVRTHLRLNDCRSAPPNWPLRTDLSPSPPSCHDGVMASQRFRAVIAAGPRDSAVIMVPFDPDEAWGSKADHPVSGTIGGCRIRTRLVPADRGWALPLAPTRLIG